MLFPIANGMNERFVTVSPHLTETNYSSHSWGSTNTVVWAKKTPKTMGYTSIPWSDHHISLLGSSPSAPPSRCGLTCHATWVTTYFLNFLYYFLAMQIILSVSEFLFYFVCDIVITVSCKGIPKYYIRIIQLS